MSISRRNVLRVGGLGLGAMAAACGSRDCRSKPREISAEDVLAAVPPNTDGFDVLIQLDGGLVYIFKNSGTALEIGFLASHAGQIRKDRGVVIPDNTFAKKLAQTKDFFDLKPWNLSFDGGGTMVADGYNCPRPANPSYPKTQEEWESLCWVPRLELPSGTQFKDPSKDRGRLSFKGGKIVAVQPDAYLAQTALWTFQKGATTCWAQAMSDRVTFKARFNTGNFTFSAMKPAGQSETVQIVPQDGLVQLVIRSGRPDPSEPYGDIKKGQTTLDHLKQFFDLRNPKGDVCVPKYTDDFPPVSASVGFRGTYSAYSVGDPYPGRYCPGMRVSI